MHRPCGRHLHASLREPVKDAGWIIPWYTLPSQSAAPGGRVVARATLVVVVVVVGGVLYLTDGANVFAVDGR